MQLLLSEHHLPYKPSSTVTKPFSSNVASGRVQIFFRDLGPSVPASGNGMSILHATVPISRGLHPDAKQRAELCPFGVKINQWLGPISQSRALRTIKMRQTPAADAAPLADLLPTACGAWLGAETPCGLAHDPANPGLPCSVLFSFQAEGGRRVGCFRVSSTFDHAGASLQPGTVGRHGVIRGLQTPRASNDAPKFTRNPAPSSSPTRHTRWRGDGDDHDTATEHRHSETHCNSQFHGRPATPVGPREVETGGS